MNVLICQRLLLYRYFSNGKYKVLIFTKSLIAIVIEKELIKVFEHKLFINKV